MNKHWWMFLWVLGKGDNALCICQGFVSGEWERRASAAAQGRAAAAAAGSEAGAVLQSEVSAEGAHQDGKVWHHLCLRLTARNNDSASVFFYIESELLWGSLFPSAYRAAHQSGWREPQLTHEEAQRHLWKVSRAKPSIKSKDVEVHLFNDTVISLPT